MGRAILSAVACLLAGAAAAATGAAAAGAPNPADLPIDDYAYDHAGGCKKHPAPGALAFVDWLERNAGGELWGIMRCERLGPGSFSRKRTSFWR
ncbi:MAG TPA: hypothetical protein VK307_10730 [Thermoleophilaceae bacterium]|nr:hypothetical protein [Thermoleophilaceae bacterium]